MDYPEEIEFDILKSRGIIERIIIILLFLCVFGFCIYAVVLFMAYFNTENKLITYILMIPGTVISLHLERQYDKRVRGEIIGRINLSSKEITIDSKQNFNFSEIKMIWINHGLNLVQDTDREYLFSGFETIKIKIIDNDKKAHNFHVNNHAQSKQRLIVSDFIEHIKSKHQFFKIHFHDQKRFSKKEYEKTLKRYSVMQSSLRRKGRR